MTHEMQGIHSPRYDGHEFFNLEGIKKIKHNFADAGIMTIKDYLVLLLAMLWRQGNQFNGKRPFGNSGWKFDIYEALVKNNVINGTLDSEHGYLNDLSDNEEKKGFDIIMEIINSLK